MKLPATAIIPSIRPAARPEAEVRAELAQLIERGARVLPVGRARQHPERLLRRYPPSFELELWNTRFFLTTVRQNPSLRFCVAYLAQPHPKSGRLEIHPRIFYKDGSLVWRSASHILVDEHGIWAGKGEVFEMLVAGERMLCSLESTTDLPLEMQTALEDLNRSVSPVRKDKVALLEVLRCGPKGRIEPYRDFVEPRRRARADRRRTIHGGKPVARFTRPGDPSSLRFVAGYEPDFRRGVIERSESKSVMFGGRIQRFRILSVNQRIQYLFFAGPDNVWIVPPQATTTELSSYGVRTIDVAIDEDLCVPGYEYHYLDETVDPPVAHSQIPAGFVGQENPHDPDRSDASPWLNRLPVIQAFRRQVLGRRPH
jgi:hypothetical protein